jgi:hypothetical protein
MGALVVLGGLNTALRAIQRVEFQAEAADLAVTLLSEVQMGQIPVVDDGPKAYEEEGLTDWTWQVATLPVQQPLGVDLPAVRQVEIIIRKTGTDFAYRLTELINEEPLAAGTDSTTTADGQAGATPADGGQAASDGTAGSGTPNYNTGGGQAGGGGGANSGNTPSPRPTPRPGGNAPRPGGNTPRPGVARPGSTNGGAGGGRVNAPPRPGGGGGQGPQIPPAPAPEGSFLGRPSRWLPQPGRGDLGSWDVENNIENYVGYLVDISWMCAMIPSDFAGLYARGPGKLGREAPGLLALSSLTPCERLDGIPCLLDKQT